VSLLFLDTSALMKLYLPELGTSWIRNFVIGQSPILSELALYESATILRRHHLDGDLTLTQAALLYARIRRESQSFGIILLRTESQLDRVVATSFSLPAGLRLRALDSIHLAAAQIASEQANRLVPPEPFVFVSSDRQLLQVAQFQGFATENPETHP